MVGSLVVITTDVAPDWPRRGTVGTIVKQCPGNSYYEIRPEGVEPRDDGTDTWPFHPSEFTVATHDESVMEGHE